MNLLIISGLLIASTSLVLIFILLVYGRSNLHKVWTLFNLAVFIWGLGCFLAGKANNTSLATFAWAVACIGGYFIAAFCYHTICIFCGLKRKKTIITFYSFALLFLFLTTVTHKLVLANWRILFGSIYYNRATPIYTLIYIEWITVVLLSNYELFRYLRKSKGIKRTQSLYLFIGLIIGFIGGGPTLFPAFGINLYPFGNFGVALYILIGTYAILRYRLLDIDVVVTRAGIFAFVYILILGFPFALIKWFKPILMQYLGSNWWVAILIFGMVLASGGPFLYMFLQRRATAYLLREDRRTHELLMKASKGLANIRELKRLINLIVSFITRTLHTTNSAIYLMEKEEAVYKLEAVRFKNRFQGLQSIDAKDPLIKFLLESRNPIVLEELRVTKQNGELRSIETQMNNLSAAVIIPSFIEETLLGFLVLGEKKSGRMYTSDDLAVLSVLSNQAALAIENAIFYEEQGKTLAQQFHEHRLRSLGKMGSGIGHQINNRFNAIAMIGGSCLISELEDLKKTPLSDEQKNDVETLEKNLNEIVQECLRGGNIARSLTQFSRTYEEFKPVKFNEIIDGTINLLSCKFNTEEMGLNVEYPEDGPLILGNLALLQDIFFNHLDNAHDACMAKREEIKNGNLKSEQPYRPQVKVSAHPQSGSWHIEIEDNGIGMTEEQLDQIFIPFFTTKATSEKGTGLGLSIIKKIIDAHKGTMQVRSKYGEGTTFMITLPIAKTEVTT